MWTYIKRNYKIILVATGFFLVGNVIAFLLEDYYRQLVRSLFHFFYGDNIRFYGKNFHLFASDKFAGSFGLFLSLSFLLLRPSTLYKRIKRISLAIFLFFATTFLITGLDGKRLIIECTACDDGIRRLTYNQVNYDAYFIISLIAAILFLLLAYFRRPANKHEQQA